MIKRKLKRYLLAGILFLPLVVSAQIGGQRSFEFQNVPTNTRLTALGGVNVSIPDEDLNMAFSNPALTSDTLSGMASFNYLSYFANVGALSAIYQHNLGKYGSWYLGVISFDYGDFEGRDPTGAVTTDFDASETLLVLGRSHTVGHFTFGASLKFTNSSIAEYAANSLALDIGGVFKHPDKELNVGIVIKNAGIVLSDYTSDDDSKLPFDVQLGTTFKPQHMPFRFSFTAYNLSKGDSAFFNTNDPNAGDEPGTADKIFRHLNAGVELLISKNVNLRAGYNHLVRQELKLEETAGGAGFSFGLMFRIKAFEFSYSRGGYHAAGGSNNFGLAVNTNRFYKNK